MRHKHTESNFRPSKKKASLHRFTWIWPIVLALLAGIFVFIFWPLKKEEGQRESLRHQNLQIPSVKWPSPQNQNVLISELEPKDTSSPLEEAEEIEKIEETAPTPPAIPETAEPTPPASPLPETPEPEVPSENKAPEIQKRQDIRTERMPVPPPPERNFIAVHKATGATFHFEKGYQEKEIKAILQYYEETVYSDLTAYYDIESPREVQFYFLTEKSETGLHVPFPNVVKDPDGFYAYGHIYIYPEEIMHNMKRIIRHEYAHHLNNHYYDGGIPMYMDEAMAYYITNYFYMTEIEKDTAANVYGVAQDYTLYYNSKYLFLVLDRHQKGNENFPLYFKYLQEYTHANAFYLAFGMTEEAFQEIYKQYVK